MQQNSTIKYTSLHGFSGIVTTIVLDQNSYTRTISTNTSKTTGTLTSDEKETVKFLIANAHKFADSYGEPGPGTRIYDGGWKSITVGNKKISIGPLSDNLPRELNKHLKVLEGILNRTGGSLTTSAHTVINQGKPTIVINMAQHGGTKKRYKLVKTK